MVGVIWMPRPGVVLRRDGIERHAEPEAGVLVGDEVFAPVGKDPVIVDPGQARHLVGEQAGAVDDPAGGERPLGRREMEEAVADLDRHDRRLEKDPGPVPVGAIRPGRS